jgi:hypothetical protein
MKKIIVDGHVFKDEHGRECSIRKDPNSDSVWIGLNKPNPNKSIKLDQETIKELIPTLKTYLKVNSSKKK